MKKLLGPLKLFFGSKGGSDWQPMILTNPNDTEIVVESLSVAGDFIHKEAQTPLTLKPMESFTVLLRYSPKSVGKHTGSVTIKTKSMAGNTAVQLFGFSPSLAAGVINFVVDDCLDGSYFEYEKYDRLNPSVSMEGVGNSFPLGSSEVLTKVVSDFGYRRGGTALFGYVFLSDREGNPYPTEDQPASFQFNLVGENSNVVLSSFGKAWSGMAYPQGYWENSRPPEGFSVARLTYKGEHYWEEDSTGLVISAPGLAEPMELVVSLKRKAFFTQYNRGVRVSPSVNRSSNYIDYKGRRYDKSETLRFDPKSEVDTLCLISEIASNTPFPKGIVDVIATPVDKDGNVLSAEQMGPYFTHMENWGMVKNFSKKYPSSTFNSWEIGYFSFPEYFESIFTNSISDLDVATTVEVGRGACTTPTFYLKGSDDFIRDSSWVINVKWEELLTQTYYRKIAAPSTSEYQREYFPGLNKDQDRAYREVVGARQLVTAAEQDEHDRNNAIVLNAVPSEIYRAVLYTPAHSAGEYILEVGGKRHSLLNWKVFGGNLRYSVIDPSLLTGPFRLWLRTPYITDPMQQKVNSSVLYSLVLSRKFLNEINTD